MTLSNTNIKAERKTTKAYINLNLENTDVFRPVALHVATKIIGLSNKFIESLPAKYADICLE